MAKGTAAVGGSGPRGSTASLEPARPAVLELAAEGEFQEWATSIKGNLTAKGTEALRDWQRETWETDKTYLSEISSEGSVIYNYTNKSYGPWNKALRENTEVPEIYQAAIQRLQGALWRRHTTRNAVVYRTINSFGPDNIFPNTLSPGERFTDRGFVSTAATKKGLAKAAANPNQTTMLIELPKGTHGRMVSDISEVPKEDEFLLPHGAHFSVISDSGAGSPNRQIRVRLIGQDKP